MPASGVKKTPTEKRLETLITESQAALEAARSRRSWKCPYCGARTAVSKLKLETEQYYVEPYSCSAGDYWTEGENPDYYITCPKCGKRAREYGDKDRYAFVKNYRWSFGERVVYKRPSRRW